MFKKLLIVLIASFTFLLNSCGKKNVPSKTASVTDVKSKKVETPAKKEKPAPEPTKTDTAAAVIAATEEKAAPKPTTEKENFPKVISVNDDAASKSVDGRLFYDVIGHRYWKNYNDGKYYLFDKSMYNNPDFKPRK